MAPASISAFALSAGLVTMIPGLDTTIVIRAATLGGPRQARAVIIGICIGLAIWGSASAIGVGALLVHSQIGFDLLRTAGAFYLIVLGLKLALRLGGSSQKTSIAGFAGRCDTSPILSYREWFIRGLLTNLLNPKVGAFYITFIPQFMVGTKWPIGSSLLLAAIHVGESLLWLETVAHSAKVLRTWIARPRITAIIEGVTGAVLIAFGLSLIKQEVDR